MSTRSFRFYLVVILLCGSFAQAFFANRTIALPAGNNLAEFAASAQETKKQKKGKGAESPDVWDPSPSSPSSKPTPGRKKTIIHRPPAHPPLTFKWRVLKCSTENGAEVEVSPDNVFHAREFFRLEIEVNQDGYLYIFNQTEGPGGVIVARPHQLFPDSRVNRGDNLIQKNKPQYVPGYCPPQYKDSCACRWRFSGDVGREVFIVIFRRQQIAYLGNYLEGDIVRQDFINQIKKKWELAVGSKYSYRVDDVGLALLREQHGGGRHTVYVTNKNLKSEELIEVISLSNKGDVSGK